MANIYKSIDSLIGNTPIIELSNIAAKLNLSSKIFAKLESFNPTSSAKDRIAKAMIETAEKNGLINSNTVIIEPTSGNTGIGLAAIAASKGLKAIIVMPDNMSKERQDLMRAFGAEVVLTPAEFGMSGSIKKANELKDKYPNSFIPDQFSNKANVYAHFETTGPEIYSDTDGNIDYFVAGVGTGGTLTGTSKFLKSKIKDIKTVAVEPENSPVLSMGKSGKHGLQGIGAGFVPEILDVSVIDEIITATEEDAYKFANLIAKTEGILVGISSGAALFAAVEIAKREVGKNIVVILPDSGERYLSSELFS